MTRVAPRHLALLLIITLLWGFNLVVSRWGLEDLPPVTFTLLRFLLVAALLFPFLRVVPGQMSAVSVAALLAGGMHFALMFAGLALAESPSSVAIAGQLGVPFTTLLSVALLGEQVRWRRWTGIVLAFAGVMVMGLDPRVFEHWPSLALVVASAFVGSLGLIAIKRLQGFRPLELQAWIAWISLPPVALLAFGLESDRMPSVTDVSIEAWLCIAYTAIASTIIAHTGFFHLVQRYPVTSVAPLTVLSPVFSVLFCVLLLDDEMTTRIAAGGALTLFGVFIITMREKRLTDAGT